MKLRVAIIAAASVAIFSNQPLATEAKALYTDTNAYWDGVFKDEPRPMQLLEGLGPIAWKVTTNSPQAQEWFNQCLALIFGFNHEDAIRSCEKALEYDPSLAMGQWGIAYAYGPNINLAFDVDRAEKANQALDASLDLLAKSTNITEKERDVIESLTVRYTNDTSYFPFGGKSRLPFDRAFFGRMNELVAKYPTDVHIKTFAAESALTLKPWEAWNYHNRPTLQTARAATPGFPEIETAKQQLVEVLQQDPNHVGAMHYIIHAVESSSDPSIALPAARRIKSVAFGQPHLVHAASHIFARVGDWSAAIISGEDAIAQDKENLVTNGAPDLYYIAHGDHNLYFLTYVNSYAGRKRATLDNAYDLSTRTQTQVVDNNLAQEYLLPMEMNFMARFRDWEKVMAYPIYNQKHKASNAFWHLNRARALIANNKNKKNGSMKAAQQEIDAVYTLMSSDTEPRLDSPDYIFQNNNVTDLINIYLGVAEGELNEAIGKIDTAVAKLTGAVEIYDTLLYDEPPPFFYPVRETLGAVNLRAGRAEAAEAVFREDLVMYPGNGRSMFGLYKALEAQGSPSDVERNNFEDAWAHADFPLSLETL